MKIQKFNESLSPDIKEYVQDFIGSVDNDVPDWISFISSQTKLKEYKGSNKLSFAKIRDLKKLEEYLSIDSKISRLTKQIEKLEESKENLEIEASNELLYKYQEELLEKDFDSLFKLFIEDEMSESNDFEDEQQFPYTNLHPQIIKKYKDDILFKINAKRYNL